MRTIKYIIPICILLLAAGCDKNHPDNASSKSIYLGVEGLGGGGTRAAVDDWDDTPVSIAYAYAPTMVFNRALDVTVSQSTGEHINAGMEYPISNAEVSFVGYHPSAVPGAMGDVSFDISKGNVDVMMSNRVTGSLSSPITDKMLFRHRLTRITFLMQCKEGESYPEPVNGISVTANNSHPLPGGNLLMTHVTLDMNSGTELFKVSGTVFNGSAVGVPVPQDHGGVVEPLVFDVMVQPGVPLQFKVVTLTEERTISIPTSNLLWTQLTTMGGVAGEQYTVKLLFSGVSILGQDITATEWKGNKVITEETTVWW